MAYDPTVSQPQGIGGTPQNRVWVYKSDDPLATVSGDDYFTDGERLGMKDGDVVLVAGAAGGATNASFT